MNNDKSCLGSDNKDETIARLKTEYHELNMAWLNLKTDKWLLEVKLRREIADRDMEIKRLLKEVERLQERNKILGDLNQRLTTDLRMTRGAIINKVEQP